MVYCSEWQMTITETLKHMLCSELNIFFSLPNIMLWSCWTVNTFQYHALCCLSAHQRGNETWNCDFVLQFSLNPRRRYIHSPSGPALKCHCDVHNVYLWFGLLAGYEHFNPTRNTSQDLFRQLKYSKENFYCLRFDYTRKDVLMITTEGHENFMRPIQLNWHRMWFGQPCN